VSFSYDPSEATSLDQVRGRVGDALEKGKLLENETIAAILVRYPDVLTASIECCKRIIALKARDIDRSAVGFSSSRSQLVTQYKDLIVLLQEEARSTLGGIGTGGAIFVGGVSDAANITQRDDADFVQPAFTIGGDDNPGA